MMQETLVLLIAFLFSDIKLGSALWDEEVSVLSNSNHILSCIGDTEFVLWYKSTNNVDVELAFSDRVFFPAYNKVELRKINKDDAGIYKCKTPMENRVLKTFKINVVDVVDEKKDKKDGSGVVKKVKAPEWTMLPDPNTIRDNSRYIVLPCRAEGVNVKVKAFRMFDNGTKKLLKDSGVVLHKPKGLDSGRYLCQAENEGGIIKHQFELLIQVHGKFSQWSRWSKCGVECGIGLKSRKRSCTNPKPENGGKMCYGMKTQRSRCKERSCESPRLVKFGYDMTGSDLILSCVGKGIPTPSVLWKYEGAKLPKQFKPKSYRTVIPKNRARSGSYSCTIRNSAGYYTMYITIDV